MVAGIEELRARGIQDLAIGAIRMYQRTISANTPAVCRYRPTCSQYGIEAIREWGVLQGILMTGKRIGRCVPPNCGYDPVPLKGDPVGNARGMLLSNSQSAPEISKEGLSGSTFEVVGTQSPHRIVSGYDHRFKLILAYPRSREFLSREDLRLKIAEFNREILAVDQFTLLFAIDEVQVGEIGDFFLLRFSGTTSGSYLETRVDEVVSLLTAQLEGFFLAVTSNEFRPLYFEVDGQVIYEPKPEEAAVPAGYNRSENLWVYTDDRTVWDVYWGDFLVDALDVLLDVATSVPFDVIDSAAAVDFGSASAQGVVDGGGTMPEIAPDGCDLGGCDVNPFDGDGCQLDGCETPGCDLHGCDVGGCDPGGCDLSGCDLSGCDASGCDLSGCDGCGS